MSIPDFDSDLGPDLAVSVYAARFTDTATDPTDELHVVVPALDDGRSKLAVEWAPIGSALPAAGDLAWVTEAVALDGDSVQWIVAGWLPADASRLKGGTGVYAWGKVTGTTGAKVAGTSNFTVARTGAGAYTVTWSPALADANYAIALSSDFLSGVAATIVDYEAQAAGSFQVRIVTQSTGASFDADWTFQVVR